ncbi:hydroxyacid dehydrogenase [Frigidibacter oleivorans]|uniref:hydroxyacid dehydrogenase n=1 Tax=Frigidibacter oleivorans TaxID=2487129 RepID=UPI000F8F407D|nr:hydroxyacid dehydrogenase [Frigidibacter oleivorans]
MPHIHISSPIHPAVVEAARARAEVSLAYGPGAVPLDAVAGRVDAVLLRSGAFTDEMMAGCPRLRIIARHGVGTDTVDSPAAARRGIWVTNTPGGNSRAVAEHVFALTLALGRRLTIASDETRRGRWAEDRAALNGIELEGRTLGLLGMGNIGAIVADIGRALGMTVIVADPALDQALPHVVPLDELLARADVLSLHVPLLPATHHIIDAAALVRMKPGAILINTGRGGLVDETALAAALRAGHLGGAGLDVLEAEIADMVAPMPHNRLPIAELPNLIVTPHVAGQTDEALMKVGMTALAEIAAVLAGGRPTHPVNAPATPFQP